MDSRDQDKCNQKNLDDYKKKIRELNDEFRKNRKGGYLRTTDGIAELGYPVYLQIIKAVAEFNDFTPDNDPHQEHDFGAINIAGHKMFWKFDYYDQDLTYASPDPADPNVTIRILTIMLASEY